MGQLEKKLEEYQEGMELSGHVSSARLTRLAHVWIETSQLLQPRWKLPKSWGYPQVMDEHFSIETGGDLGIPHFKNPPDVDIFPGAPCQAFE